MKERNEQIEAYYIKNRSALIKKVAGRAGTPENAEDIVQNAFLKALQYWPSYDARVKGFDEWFGRILSNALRDFMTDERNYGMAMEFDEEEQPGVEMPSISDNLREKIQKEIGLASVKNQEVLSLYYTQGYSMKEVVEITDLKYKDVDTTIQRFRKHIQERYKTKL